MPPAKLLFLEQPETPPPTTLEAQFVLDGQGNPMVVSEPGESPRRYRVRLFIRDYADLQPYLVTYELDDSFDIRLRQARDAASDFEEIIDVSGDFEVKATVWGKQDRAYLYRQLGEALLASSMTRPFLVDHRLKAAIDDLTAAAAYA